MNRLGNGDDDWWFRGII